MSWCECERQIKFEMLITLKETFSRKLTRKEVKIENANGDGKKKNNRSQICFGFEILFINGSIFYFFNRLTSSFILLQSHSFVFWSGTFICITQALNTLLFRIDEENRVVKCLVNV